MNIVALIGNLTKDVELRYTTDQKPIARFSVAVNDGYGEKQRTSYIPIVVFGKQAENADRYLSKGSKVAVNGRIQTGSYEKEGRTIYTTDIIASNIEFLSAKQSANSERKPDELSGFTALSEDEVPF
jgi:single-strand DNA-binding protein